MVNAAAGAQRVFDLMDQEPEKDEGYVELVNVKEDEDGSLTESAERTNLWAWKHPHKADGTVTYRKLEGGVVFDDVDFGYNGRQDCAASYYAVREAGTEDCLCRCYRRGQDHRLRT